MPLSKVGLDPGVNTGFALTDTDGRLVRVETMAIHLAMQEVAKLWLAGELGEVVFEDARLRVWFGGTDARQDRSGPGVREGVGSVKRDCSIWEGFLQWYGIPYRAVKPAAGSTKVKAGDFLKLTGWKRVTSEHSRDAAMLVFSRRCA